MRGLSVDLFENVAFVGTQMGLIIQHSIVVALEVTDYNQPGEALGKGMSAVLFVTYSWNPLPPTSTKGLFSSANSTATVTFSPKAKRNEEVATSIANDCRWHGMAW